MNYLRKITQTMIEMLVVFLMVLVLLVNMDVKEKNYICTHDAMNKTVEWLSDDFQPLDVPMDADLQEYLFHCCEAYNVDFRLALAVIQKESSFNPNLISSTNDYGLFQINRINHKWLSESLGLNDFLNPEQNIHAGVFVLSGLTQKYSEPHMVLMAYNIGENGAKKLWNNGVYQTGYSKAVLRIRGEL